MPGHRGLYALFVAVLPVLCHNLDVQFVVGRIADAMQS